MIGQGTHDFYPHDVVSSYGIISDYTNSDPSMLQPMAGPSTVGNVGYPPYHDYYGPNSKPVFHEPYQNPFPSTTVNPSQFYQTDVTNNDSANRVDRKTGSIVKPTSLLRRDSTASTHNARYDLNFDGGPQEMRNRLVGLEDVDVSLREKRFSKEPKASVTSDKSRRASDSRRRHEAKYTCPLEGCNDNFTRKHNLDSEHTIRIDIMRF